MTSEKIQPQIDGFPTNDDNLLHRKVLEIHNLLYQERAAEALELWTQFCRIYPVSAKSAIKPLLEGIILSQLPAHRERGRELLWEQLQLFPNSYLRASAWLVTVWDDPNYLPEERADNCQLFIASRGAVWGTDSIRQLALQSFFEDCRNELENQLEILYQMLPDAAHPQDQFWIYRRALQSIEGQEKWNYLDFPTKAFHAFPGDPYFYYIYSMSLISSRAGEKLLVEELFKKGMAGHFKQLSGERLLKLAFLYWNAGYFSLAGQLFELTDLSHLNLSQSVLRTFGLFISSFMKKLTRGGNTPGELKKKLDWNYKLFLQTPGLEPAAENFIRGFYPTIETAVKRFNINLPRGECYEAKS